MTIRIVDQVKTHWRAVFEQQVAVASTSSSESPSKSPREPQQSQVHEYSGSRVHRDFDQLAQLLEHVDDLVINVTLEVIQRQLALADSNSAELTAITAPSGLAEGLAEGVYKLNLALRLEGPEHKTALRQAFVDLVQDVHAFALERPAEFEEQGGPELALQLLNFIQLKSSFFKTNSISSRDIEVSASGETILSASGADKLLWTEDQNQSLFKATLFLPVPTDGADAEGVFLTFHRFGGKVGPHSDAVHIHAKNRAPNTAAATALDQISASVTAFFQPTTNENRLRQALADDFAPLAEILPKGLGYSWPILKQYLEPALLERVQSRVLQTNLDQCHCFFREQVLPLAGHTLSSLPFGFTDRKFQALCEQTGQPPLALYRAFEDAFRTLKSVQMTVLGIGANRDGQLPASVREHLIDAVRVEHKGMADIFQQLCQHRQGSIEAKMNAMRGIPIGLRHLTIDQCRPALSKQTYQRDLRKALVDMVLTQAVQRPQDGPPGLKYEQYTRQIVRTKSGVKDQWVKNPDGLYFYPGGLPFDPSIMKRAPFAIREDNSKIHYGELQSSASLSQGAMKSQYQRVGVRRGDLIYDSNRVVGFQECSDGQFLSPLDAPIHQGTPDNRAFWCEFEVSQQAWSIGKGFVPLNLEREFGFPSELCASFTQRMLSAAFHHSHSPLFMQQVQAIREQLLLLTRPNVAATIDVLTEKLSDASPHDASLLSKFAQQMSDATTEGAVIKGLQLVNQLLDRVAQENPAADVVHLNRLWREQIEGWIEFDSDQAESWRLVPTVNVARLLDKMTRTVAPDLAQRLQKPASMMAIPTDLTPEQQYEHYFNVIPNAVQSLVRFGDFLNGIGHDVFRKPKTGVRPTPFLKDIAHNIAGSCIMLGSIVPLSVKFGHDMLLGVTHLARDLVKLPLQYAKKAGTKTKGFLETSEWAQHHAHAAKCVHAGALVAGGMRGVAQFVGHRVLFNGTGARTLRDRYVQAQQRREDQRNPTSINVFRPTVDLHRHITDTASFPPRLPSALGDLSVVSE